MITKEHYKDLVENASDLIQCVNPQGKFEYVNKVWKSKLGYSDQEIKNLSLWDIIHPESMQHCVDTFQKVMKGDEVGYVEASFISKAKKRIYVEGNVNCRCDEKGNIITTRGIFRDVSKQKKLQNQLAVSINKLKKSNNLQKVLLDISASFVDTNKKDFNKQINSSLKILGKGVNADRIYVFEYDFENDTTSNLYEWCADGVKPEIDNLQNIPLEIIRDWVDRHLKGEPVQIHDVSELDKNVQLYEHLKEQGIKSMLAVPMMKGGVCFGFIGFDSVKQKRRYTFEEKNHLRQIANVYTSVLQRKEIEDELQKSQHKYKSLIENLSEIVYVLDNKANIVYLSPNIELTSGYKSKELIGRNFIELVHPDDVKGRMKQFNKVLQGHSQPSECRFLTKENRVVWVRTNAKVIYENGKVSGIQGVLTDITDLKNSEKRLTENTLFLNTVLESIQEGVAVINADYTVDYMNPTMKKWNNGINLLGDEKCYNVLKDRDTVCENCVKDRCIATGKPQTSEEIYKLSDGNYKIVEVYCYPFQDNDKVKKVVEFIIDITEKKNIEKRLIDSEQQNRRLISQMQQGLLVAEAVYDKDKTFSDYKVLLVNKSFEKIIGIKKEQLEGRGLIEVFPEEEKKWFSRFASIIKDKKPVQFEDFSDTIKKWFRVSAYSPKNGQIAVIVDDISEKKILEYNLYYEKEQFRTTLLSVGDGVIAVDKNQKIVLINRVAEKLTGWTRKTAIGKRFEEVYKCIDENTGKKCFNVVNTVFQKAKVVDSETNNILVSKDGTKRPIEENAAPIKNKNGEITGAVLVFKDITDKKDKQDKILFLSYHDQLTGLYNRRFFDEHIKFINTKENLPLTIVMLDVNGLKLVNDAFGHLVGDKLLKKVASILDNNTEKNDVVSRVGGDEFIIIYNNTDKQGAIEKMKNIMDLLSNEKIEGMHLSVSYGWETKKDLQTDFMDIYKRAEDHMYRRKLSESQSMRHNAVNVILKTLYEKSQREQLHSQRVSGFCVELGRALGLAKEEIKEIRTAGLMHDIGKIIIPDDILNKEEKLTPSDWITIKRHPETGYKILSSVNEFAPLSKEVLQHHEKWDGSGYPEGLKGEQIEYRARIIAVADAYDAMITDRPYRKALSKEEAIKEIIDNAGTQFDPHIAKVFVDLIR